jgi:hypothetical protein
MKCRIFADFLAGLKNPAGGTEKRKTRAAF